MATWKTEGTCASNIHFEVDGDIIKNVSFEGGCPGNALGLSSLIEGMKIDDAIVKMKGIKCGNKATSCPDQLALALTEWKKQQ